MDADLGSLILRVALGPMLVAHGMNKLIGTGGLNGTAAWFESLGLRPARLHARLAAASEMAVGSLMLIGFLTPFAAGGTVGLMAVAALTDHRGKGYFVFKGGSEYVMLVATVAVALTALGPGEWSLDGLLGIELAGAWWAAGASALGLVAAALLILASYRPAQADTRATSIQGETS